MSERFDFKEVEERWAKRWEADRAWCAPAKPVRDKKYVLEMYPYPSGDMHMGHVENYAIGDAFARYWTMSGFDVMHPFGYDAFGLPAENKAIQEGIPPRDSTYANIEKFTRSCKRLAYTYDWERSFNTCDPGYYKWNQWLFLRLLERDLAYRKMAKVNWCPKDRTVLANEQLSSGVCWRCGSVPEVRDLEQWFFRTTAYADRLLADMDQLEWGDAVLTQQRNWIGRSEGASVTFTIEQTGDEVPIFTTRPDTLWGVTFFVFAPEHPIAHELALRAGKRTEYDAFVEEIRRKTEIERLALESAKRAFDLEAHAVNPVNGERVAVFASDYVLMEYGTGAIMAVPAHDQRDFEFARQYDLPIRVVIQPESAEALRADAMEVAYPGEGVMVGSDRFTGRPSEAGRADVVEWLSSRGKGEPEVQFRLRDWTVSRQRYWGTPIPVVYCDDCGIVAVPDEQLPIELPVGAQFRPSDDGVAPLSAATDWVQTTCPRCAKPARRETDTMDTFVDSSWYFLRFCDAHNDDAIFDRALVDAWMPVDQYTGGIEHAVMHLIYARFVTKVLHDMGLVGTSEPFKRLLNHGMILKDGKMMSKSLGNVVEPDEVMNRFGTDALRIYILFIGPPDQDFDWPLEGADSVRGAHRFVERVWRLVTENEDRLRGAAAAPSGSSSLRRFVHRKLSDITGDYERWAYNTAIAKLMELFNGLHDAARGGATDSDLREGTDVLLHCLAPVAPYLTEELWSRLNGDGNGSIHTRRWPKADPDLAKVERVTMVVQVDSKVRDRIEVDADISEDDAAAAALGSEKVREQLAGREPARVIARPPRLVNVLTR